MADSAAVAARVWDDYLPRSTRSLIGRSPGGSRAREVFVWLAAAHDLGKASRAFAVQNEHLVGLMERHNLRMHGVTIRTPRPPHSQVGQLLLERWLTSRHDWSRDVAETYAVVVGGHHGVTPARRELNDVKHRWHLIGDGAWTPVQDELADYAAELAGIRDDLADLRHCPLSPLAQASLTAAVIMADWIASNDNLFTYDLSHVSADRADRAWVELGLPGPWLPRAPEGSADALIKGRFDLPADASARPVQRAAVDTANTADMPGLLVIEAPMGEGKTEAALAAAEVLAARVGAGGVFVALPTMATSNAMFSRVRDWVDALHDERGGGVVQTMFLAHGKAGLNDEFRGLFRHGSPSGVGIDEDPRHPDREAATAHEWLRGRKKGVLANFVVGTIDQVLFGALRSKHVVLRHLALLNKVVVIDEVHAADDYMSVYLERMLGWLGAYGIPTILLSATLPPRQRSRLVRAYEGAYRDATAAERPASSFLARLTATRVPAPAGQQDSSRDPVADEVGYPLVISSGADAPIVTVVPSSGRSTDVYLERLDDDPEQLVELLQARLSDGGCVAVIRNTVGRAQETARVLETAFPGSVTLTHARFLATDRAERDTRLLQLLGRTSETQGRHGPHIVVGTQVLEQSLDIDVDLLVTDLAPLDLVLQRIGRLHRHRRGAGEHQRPEPLRRAVCVITGIEDWAADPLVAVSGSRAVYGESLLLRAALVLDEVFEGGGRVRLPQEIPTLIRRAYADNLVGPPSWGAALADADTLAKLDRDRRQHAAAIFAIELPKRVGSILGWASHGVGEAEDSPTGQAQVRDADETLEVVVVQRVGAEIRTVPWLPNDGGVAIPTDFLVPSRLARVVAGCTVRLPSWLSSPWQVDRVIGALERNAFAGWQQSPWLSGQLVLVLDEEWRANLAGTSVAYDLRLGLLVEPSKKG